MGGSYLREALISYLREALFQGETLILERDSYLRETLI